MQTLKPRRLAVREPSADLISIRVVAKENNLVRDKVALRLLRAAEDRDLTNIPGTKTRGRVQQEQPVADKVGRLLELVEVLVAAKEFIQVRRGRNTARPEWVKREREVVQ